LALVAAEPAEFLMEFAGREPALLERAEELAEQRLARAVGETREVAAASRQRIRSRRLEYLVKSKQFGAAGQLLARFTLEELQQDSYTLLPLRVRVAAKAGQLPALLTELTDTEQLRSVAAQLRDEGDAESARQILLLAYERELAGPNPSAGSYLGLAEIQPARAVELLDRLVMTMGEPFAYHAAAAGVLLAQNRGAEAARYAEPLAKAAPWSAEARLLLARAKGDEATLVTVAMDGQAAYGTRLEAAQALNRSITTGARELDLLAGRVTSATEAEQPYVVTARLKAAAAATDGAVKVRLLRAVLALQPDRRLPLFRVLNGVPLLALAEDGSVPAEIREAVGDAFVKAGQPHRAVLYYEGLPAKQAAAQAEVDRRMKNEARRPLVQEGLEQPHTVKPRLLAGAR